jgi:hypothetical protein
MKGIKELILRDKNRLLAYILCECYFDLRILTTTPATRKEGIGSSLV